MGRWAKVGRVVELVDKAAASATSINVNGAVEYQWKAMLNLVPGTQYCYRVYLRTGVANEIDLLGSDPTPTFWTQVPAGLNQPYSFAVFGDWGYVDEAGNNPFHSNLISL